jgi:hypothetical protein
MELKVEHEPMGETETMGIGWLFAPVIGAWGWQVYNFCLWDLELGNARSFGWPAFFLLYVGCVYGLWMASSMDLTHVWWVHLFDVCSDVRLPRQ